jgi:CheY-like chemotaxis protein/anti-sigma regulatory factor (Ser/Thr protein kinase)
MKLHPVPLEAFVNPSSSSPPDTIGAVPSAAGNTVLVVDDSAMDRHLAGAIVQKMGGWNATFAGNGVEALAVLEQQPPDVVLTDMLMPEMDGLQLVQAIRSKYPTVPVILMTAHGSEDIAIQALQKGAASYVPKKSLARDLAETLEQVFAASKSRMQEKRLLACLDSFETSFTLDNDTGLIPSLVGLLEDDINRLKLCDAGGLVLLGVALHEAITNAILHGNLELDSAQRENDEKEYYRQSVNRRGQSPYAERRVYVSAKFTRAELSFTIRDEGNGFDPNTLPDPTDPSNLGRVSGRGLLLIQTFMDRVEHNPKGNQITMTKRCALAGR